MKAICATWVESVFGAAPPHFQARFVLGNIGVSATYALADELYFKARTVGGWRSSNIVEVADGDEARRRLAADGKRLVEQRLEHLRHSPGVTSGTPARVRLDTAYGIESACASCGGRGRVNCYACYGTSQVTCPHCGGRGTRSCGSCGGAGQKSVPVQTPSGFTYQYVSCGACSGGRVMCYCAGLGKTTCFACQAGTINCNPCFGSGRQTRIHSAKLAISVTAQFRVTDAPDEFVAQSARAAPEAIALHTRLKTPGRRHQGSQAIGYDGECAVEDGMLTLAGRSSRIVAIGTPQAAMAATCALDEPCLGYRERLGEAAGDGLLSLLAFADGNRLAATQVLTDVRRGRPRTIRIGIERRGLASQSLAEEKLTDAVLSREFRDACVAAIAASVDLHAAHLKDQLRVLYRQAVGRLLAGASIGLALEFAFLFPPLAAYRTDRVMRLSYLGWIGIVAAICGLIALVPAVRIHRAERKLLSERPAPEADSGEVGDGAAEIPGPA